MVLFNDRPFAPDEVPSDGDNLSGDETSSSDESSDDDDEEDEGGGRRRGRDASDSEGEQEFEMGEHDHEEAGR